MAAGRTVYRSPAGPSMPSGSRVWRNESAASRAGISGAEAHGVGGGGVAIYLDLMKCSTEISRVLHGFASNVKRVAMYNALNHVGAKALTRIRRDVTKSSGASYSQVSKAIVLDKAHPNRLYFRIAASDKAMPLIAFVKGAVRGTPRTKRNKKSGRTSVTANPWNKSRTFRDAFIIPIHGKKQVVVRTANRTKGDKNSGAVKVLWGPIIPREMLREGNPSTQYLQRVVPLEIIPRLIHELKQALARGVK